MNFSEERILNYEPSNLQSDNNSELIPLNRNKSNTKGHPYYKSESKFVLEYISSNYLFALAFQNSNLSHRVAISSYNMNTNNKLEIVTLEKKKNFLAPVRNASASIEFPSTKIQWSPDLTYNEIFLSAGDIIRMYKYIEHSSSLNPIGSLYHKTDTFQAPVTSLDWSLINLNLVLSSAIDSTCTLWDLKKNAQVLRISANDKEVFDTCFKPDSEFCFFSAGGDCKVRAFDTRDSSVYSEIFSCNSPVLKLKSNSKNSNILVTSELGNSGFSLLDIRSPGKSIASVKCNIFDFCLCNNNQNLMSTVGQDGKVLIWDILTMSDGATNPISEFSNNKGILGVDWSNGEWLAISYDKSLKFLRF